MTTLAHKERTLQDIIDEMTPEQKELQALIVGAAVEDEVINDDDVLAEYEALPEEQRLLVDFMVGNILAESSLDHDALRVNAFLEHFGVKGMKWGVRKSSSSTGGPRLSKMASNTKENRREAREKVRSGVASLGEAHRASLKSVGHRAVNAFTGDKTFWKRTAIAAGVAGGVAGAAAAAPFVLPASTLAAIGSFSLGAAGASGVVANGVAGTTIINGSVVSLASVGQVALASAGVSAASLGLTGATAVNAASNVVRAVRGNSRVDRSHASLGKTLQQRQTAGSKQVQKVLNRNGSIRKRNLRQSDDLRVDQFLEHHASVNLGQMKSGI